MHRPEPLNNVSDLDRRDARLVTVVGSAQINREDPRWDGAFDLGRQLAVAGWTVVTGGYRGLMAAAARGAKSVGGATVGLPISSWTHLAPDESHDELWWCENFSARDPYAQQPGGRCSRWRRWHAVRAGHGVEYGPN